MIELGGPASRPNLSFVIPVRDDVRVLRTLLRLRRFAATRQLTIETIVCGVLPAVVLRRLPCKFISVIPPRKGRCVRRGILVASSATIVVCDADLPIGDADLDLLIEASKTKSVVFASRIGAGASVDGTSRLRLFCSKLFRSLQWALFSLDLDTQCGVKVFQRSVAAALTDEMLVGGLLYDTEIALRCRSQGIAIAEVPVAVHNDKNSVVGGVEASVQAAVGLCALWLHAAASRSTKGDHGLPVADR